MKSCPVCKRTYADDTFSFCLDDGALLSVNYDPVSTLPVPGARDTDPPRTEILPSEWRPVRSTIPVPTTSAHTSKAGQSHPPQKHSSKHWIILSGTLALLAGGLVIVVGYMAWKVTNTSVSEPSRASTATPTDNKIPANANSTVYANLKRD